MTTVIPLRCASIHGIHENVALFSLLSLDIGDRGVVSHNSRGQDVVHTMDPVWPFIRYTDSGR